MKLTNGIPSWAACLLFTAPIFAGSVTIANKTSLDVEVEAYDWDDALKTDSRDSRYLAKNAKVTLTCRKSWWVSDSPGCNIYVRGAEGSKKFGRLDTGSYDLTVSNSREYQLTQRHGSEVSLELMALPAPGGGTTDCVAANPGGKILDNAKANLLWQNDGNLVIYRNDGGGPVWASDTAGKAKRLCFQGDGNLVIYNGPTAVWATDTDGRGSRLKLQADCNLVIEDQAGNAVWASGTHCY